MSFSSMVRVINRFSVQYNVWLVSGHDLLSAVISAVIVSYPL